MESNRAGSTVSSGISPDILPDILELAREVLPLDKLKEAMEICEMIGGSKKQREFAKARIRLLVAPPPKRPLHYLMQEMRFLPRDTRDCIRYLGDYIDLLTKELAFENLGGNTRRNSLGRNAKLLAERTVGLKDLGSKLQRYGSVLYTPGKHDFTLPPGREHRFTAKEVVLAAYVTVELAERIKSVSKSAREAVKQDTWYTIGGRWGSPDRVRYVGPSA
jgi:hypothetical protein